MNEDAPARSIAQALSARLRDEILRGTFAAGEHLRETHLAAMFGASRTPVRHALAANEKDGLLEYTAHRGFVVRPFDAADIDSAFEMRALIDGFAARRAAEIGLSLERERVADSAIARVDALLRSNDLLDEAARDTWRTENARFHRALAEQTGNRFVRPILAQVQQIPSVYPPIMSSYEPASLRQYNQEHRAILDCVLAREGGRAEFLMCEHVLGAGRAIRTAIDEKKTTIRKAG